MSITAYQDDQLILQGKVALLSGANGGIGLSVCEIYASNGAKCMVLDLGELELKFIIDGTDYGTAFTVEKGTYRAAVNLSEIGDTVELLSIDHSCEIGRDRDLSSQALTNDATNQDEP